MAAKRCTQVGIYDMYITSNVGAAQFQLYYYICYTNKIKGNVVLGTFYNYYYI